MLELAVPQVPPLKAEGLMSPLMIPWAPHLKDDGLLSLLMDPSTPPLKAEGLLHLPMLAQAPPLKIEGLVDLLEAESLDPRYWQPPVHNHLDPSSATCSRKSEHYIKMHMKNWWNICFSIMGMCMSISCKV